MIKIGSFERARGEISAQHGDGIGLLQGILAHKPATYPEHKRGTGKEREQSQCAENGQDAEGTGHEFVGAVSGARLPIPTRGRQEFTFVHEVGGSILNAKDGRVCFLVNISPLE